MKQESSVAGGAVNWQHQWCSNSDTQLQQVIIGSVTPAAQFLTPMALWGQITPSQWAPQLTLLLLLLSWLMTKQKITLPLIWNQTRTAGGFAYHQAFPLASSTLLTKSMLRLCESNPTHASVPLSQMSSLLCLLLSSMICHAGAWE